MHATGGKGENNEKNFDGVEVWSRNLTGEGWRWGLKKNCTSHQSSTQRRGGKVDQNSRGKKKVNAETK